MKESTKQGILSILFSVTAIFVFILAGIAKEGYRVWGNFILGAVCLIIAYTRIKALDKAKKKEDANGGVE